MTRKRFVKLCMARGYSRNEANEMAREGIGTCGSYSELFVIMLMCSSDFHKEFCEAVQYAVDRIQEFCGRLADEIHRIVRLLQE